MSPEQFSSLITEVRGVKLALYVTAALIVVSVVFTAIRTYFAARHQLDRELNDAFNQEAEILFEKNKLDQLIPRCRALLEERPNHAYARWYLGRSLLLQQEWAVALEQLSILRRKFPNWAANVDPLINEARTNLDGLPSH
jgi:tetratricopeptide (TPR) repeat protein